MLQELSNYVKLESSFWLNAKLEKLQKGGNEILQSRKLIEKSLYENTCDCKRKSEINFVYIHFFQE